MTTKIKTADGMEPNGVYTMVECDPSRALEEYQDLLAFLKDCPFSEAQNDQTREAHAIIYRAKLGRYHEKARIREHVFHNLVPTVGKNVFARILAGNTTYTGIVNYAGLGDDATTPTDGDTVLGNETYRKTVDSATYVNNVAYLSIFIPAATATGTHSEAGLFIDGTGSVDTGQIFSHVLLSPPVVKSALSSLTLDCTITIA